MSSIASTDPKRAEKLLAIANECRIDILRMLETAGSDHSGSSLSVIDIVVALYFCEMRIDAKNPSWEERDRFVLSKGHGVPAIYATLAKLGAIPHHELSTPRKINPRLQGHPDRVALPFIEASTGSLGPGLSVAQGLALGAKLKRQSSRVFCVLGDGEIQEGQVWEAAMSAPKFKLNNLVVFVDHKNGQIDETGSEVMDLAPLADKWRSFRWAVQEIHGHDFDQILDAIQKAKQETERPSLIIARTVNRENA